MASSQDKQIELLSECLETISTEDGKSTVDVQTKPTETAEVNLNDDSTGDVSASDDDSFESTVLDYASSSEEDDESLVEMSKEPTKVTIDEPTEDTIEQANEETKEQTTKEIEQPTEEIEQSTKEIEQPTKEIEQPTTTPEVNQQKLDKTANEPTIETKQLAEESTNEPTNEQTTAVKKSESEQVESTGKVAKCSTTKLSLVETFEEMNISSSILRGLESVKIKRPNELQQTLIPALMSEEYRGNLFIQTTPCSGKKTAFLIALLERIETDLEHVQVVILAPTKDLVLQITDSARQIAKFTKTKIRCAIREKNLPKKIKEHVLVTTIGQLLYLCSIDAFDTGKLKLLCCDEFDVLSSGRKFVSDLRVFLRTLVGIQVQLQIYSTCYNSKSLKFVKSVTAPVHLNLFELERCFNNVVQFYVYCESKNDKFKSLLNIIKNTLVDKVMIFTSNSAFGEMVFRRLRSDGYMAKFMTGSTKIQYRQDLVEKFKFAKQMILITTYPLNVGINLNQVELIINFDLTTKNRGFYGDYPHRVRSCSKNIKPGFVINIVDRVSLNYLRKMESIYNIKIVPLDALNLDRNF